MARLLRKAPKPKYSRSVFVNCPFDAAYQPFFRALTFTVEDCGFFARCAVEADDSGEARAGKIIRLIRESQFGIHDISRTELGGNQLPRFNMPYEFGIFIGFKYAGGARQQRKQVLVLDREKYRYQQFLSDIAGQDIRSHDNQPEQLIQQVRHWLQYRAQTHLPGAAHVIQRFNAFQAQTSEIVARLNKSPADLDNYFDFHNIVTEWIAQNP
jgi:hypothetical protein